MNDTCELVSPRWRRMAQVAASSLLLAGLFPVQSAAALTVTATTSDNGYFLTKTNAQAIKLDP